MHITQFEELQSAVLGSDKTHNTKSSRHNYNDCHRNVGSSSSTARCRFRSIAEVRLSNSSSQTKQRSFCYDLPLQKIKYTTLCKIIKRAILQSNLPHKTLFISIMFIKPYLLPDITDMMLYILYIYIYIYICTHTLQL
jgi:hypothetical protein